MAKTIVAHFTDTHLGQKLVMDGDIDGNKMRYDSVPGWHKEHLHIVLDDIARKGIANVIFGGDIGTRESVPGFFELLSGYDFTPTIMLGNHDAYDNVTPYCRIGAGAVQGRLCLSHDDRHPKCIFLDSSDNTVGDDQRAWLARELDGVGKAALFVHHPVLKIDTPVDRSGAALKDREEVKTLLAGADCDVSVFCGHFHMIDEAREANIRQFATPAVSYQIVKHADRIRVDTETFGYRILAMDAAEIRTEVVLFTEA
jgi:3',5'-cyclic-AMP phosphodiesterase